MVSYRAPTPAPNGRRGRRSAPCPLTRATTTYGRALADVSARDTPCFVRLGAIPDEQRFRDGYRGSIGVGAGGGQVGHHDPTHGGAHVARCTRRHATRSRVGLESDTRTGRLRITSGA